MRRHPIVTGACCEADALYIGAGGCLGPDGVAQRAFPPPPTETRLSLVLNHHQVGESGSPIVIAHGLFGSTRNWSSMAKRLADNHRVFLLDLRNHGDSPWADDMGFPAMADDVRRFIDDHRLDRPVAIGHSLGGKTMMALALAHPECVRAMVAVDIAPVAYTGSFIRYVNAMKAMDLSRVEKRSDADTMLADAVPEAGVRQFLLQSLVLGEGAPRWRLNLAALGEQMERMGQALSADLGAPYTGPALFLGGGASPYLRPEHEPAIMALFPNAEIDFIAGAGHWVHADRPDEFLARLTRFLNGLEH